MASNEIPQSVIDQANYDIVGVIGKRIDLRPAGKELLGHCPFHDGKSRKLNVNEAKGLYLCRSCGATGTAIKFVMEYDGLRFRDAVESIVGNMPASVTPEQIAKRATAAKVNYPAANREDPEKAEAASLNFQWAEQHDWLKSRNTAPFGKVATTKGYLAVEIIRDNKLVNVAAISNDKISWLAGGPSYGGTVRLEPQLMGDLRVTDHDNEIILCLDYADAWRVWWLRGGRSIVMAAIDPDNFIWMQYQQKHVFTMVADYAEAIADLEERGHRTFVIPPAYQRKEKALG